MPSINSTRVVKTACCFVFLYCLTIQKLSSQDNLSVKKRGTFFGISLGTWFPDNNNKKLGIPGILGFSLNEKYSRNSFGIGMDIIGFPKGKTRDPIMVKYHDTILLRNEYWGAQVTIDYFRELASPGTFVIEAIGSFGLGRMEYYNPDKDTHVGRFSPVLSPGFGIRHISKKSSYLHLKIQYNIVNYSLKDNISTKLNGNFLLLRLVLGGVK